MHINRVTVHGFKSYNDTVVFGPFAQGKNALVGLNGTGKSNFYAAIGFVLLDEFAHIRVADRKALLHEGQGQNSMTAYVEIVFDNKSRTIPIDNDEVSIRRSIGLKKDEYFIDRKNSTRQDVHNLLESCGFSPSSGYYIVRQGRVNALALMKDSDRLGLLYDIAGTKFYDQQREESMKMIKESDSRTEKINESLKYIQNRLAQLEGEKEELEEYEKIDKEKRAVEYLIQDIELNKVIDELEAATESKKSASENAANYKRQLDDIHPLLKENQDKLRHSQLEESRLKKDKENSEKEKNAILVSKTKTESKIESLKSEIENVNILRADFTDKLNRLESDLEKSKNELNDVNANFESISQHKGEIQGKVDALSQIVDQTFRDTSSTEKELAQSRETLNNYIKKSQEIKTEINEKQEYLNSLISKRQVIDNEIKETNSEIQNHQIEQRKLMDNKKKLDRSENDRSRHLTDLQNQLDKLTAKMNSSLPAESSAGIDAIQNLKEKNEIEGIYGTVYELIKCPDELAVAASTVGKGQLFYVVVENNDVAVKVLNTLTNQKLGSATLLALDTVNERNRPIEFPEAVTSLSSQLTYDRKFEKVINLVFGKTILAHSLEEANELVEKYKMDVVTIDGDFFSAHGPITGGSRSHKHSPILIQSKIKHYQTEFEHAQEEYNRIKEERQQVKQSIVDIQNSLDQAENENKEKEKEKFKVNMAISDCQAEIDGQTSRLDQLTPKIEEAERRVFSVEKRLDYLNNFNSQVDQSTLNELEEYRKEYDQIRSQFDKISTRKNELTLHINKTLIPRHRALESKLENLDPDKLTISLEHYEMKRDEDQANLERLVNLFNEIDQKLIDVTNIINSLDTEINTQQSQEDTLRTNLSYHQNQIESIDAQIALLEQRREKYLEQQKAGGALPEAEISQFEGQSMSQLMRHLKNINQELNNYRHVNKKAIEQHRAFTQQQEELTARQNELQQSNESIQKLIQKLDEKKDVAIARTFQQISDYFKSILTELEPRAHGQLVLQCDEKTKEYSGIAIKAQFEDQEVTTLSQLSGGQKALIALTLVFSIQKYSPAPFYLFDEVDSALDDKYRVSVSNLMDKFCHPTDGSDPVQIIFTTFKKELLNNCDKYFAVKYTHGHSTALEISEEEANSIVSEHNDETF